MENILKYDQRNDIRKYYTASPTDITFYAQWDAEGVRYDWEDDYYSVAVKNAMPFR